MPKTPPGMHRNKCRGTPRSVASILRPCVGCAEASAQTEVSLPHVHRDILWTAACLEPVADVEDDDASGVIETHASHPSVLDIDSVEAVQYDEVDDPDETDELDGAATKSDNKT